MKRARSTPTEAALSVRTEADIERYMMALEQSARRVKDCVTSHVGGPLDLLRKMKFEKLGWHPIEDRELNLVEQINQTWTYAVALAATRYLLNRHPEAEGFCVAPGAHMAIPLDIMSVKEGVVGAETFAAVHPQNNRKLERDLRKMVLRTETHRYVFFNAPGFVDLRRQEALERGGPVEVWSVAV